jgi:pyridoxine/pyridoxamine 5'-phosphate oxidase
MPKDYGIKGPRIRAQIVAAHNYWIVTARPDGRPHAMPVWGVWLRESLLFSTSRDSRKARNLAGQPYLVVHLESGNEAVILEGLAEVVSDAKLLAQYVEAYEAKCQFRLDPKDTKDVTYAVRPQVAFAWSERDFSGGATRWRF